MSNKDIPLEALRGLAALAVVFCHLGLGFWPLRSGFPMYQAGVSINDRFWFGIANGGAAVSFFFVLSAFVLTRQAMQTGTVASLARGAIKRWPRLAMPVLLTVLFSYALAKLGLYHYEAAGQITSSPWLKDFASGLGGQPFRPDLPGAIWQALYEVFFRAKVTSPNYDSSLWTMHYEFLGSFLAFGLAALLIQLRTSSNLTSAFLLLVAALIVIETNSWYLMFVAGVALSLVFTTHRPNIPVWIAIPLALFGLYLAGYVDGRGDYRWIVNVLGYAPLNVHIFTAGAMMLIYAVDGSAFLRRHLTGRWAAILGRLSFPIYLLHVLVLCSAGAAVFVALQEQTGQPWAKIIAAATTLAGTLLVAAPLAWFDIKWTEYLNRFVRRHLAAAERQI
ncbi:MAG: acyltransferase [Parvibaculaceae bacterium]|nr:acyltransferase [Parvibaculaceae bacterium]